MLFSGNARIAYYYGMTIREASSMIWRDWTRALAKIPDLVQEDSRGKA